MSKNYTRDQLKISVAKILHTLGWNSINSTPLEILTEILGSYITQICKTANNYSNEFGQTIPNLDHLGLSFRDMGISVAELEEYVRYVNFGPPPHPVPRYPIPKENHLNFLKPGSKEVVTRPVHIHEHLPPMNPLFEGNENDAECVATKADESDETNADIFKKPADLPLPRPSIRREEEGSRPTREISSVMMTTSGFLSPAREGKLPEARTPAGALDPIGPINTSTSETPDVKKPNKVVKKVEKKKDKVVKDSFKAVDDKAKKMSSVKCIVKGKQGKAPHIFNSLVSNNDVVKVAPIPNNKINQNNKVNKALAAARLKTEKLNTTITPITIKPVSPHLPQSNIDNVDKLFTEPDKKKVNIFKKISNVKNEKTDSKKKEDLRQESRESSPDLIIDEPDEIVTKLSHLPSDVTIEPINPPAKSPEKVENPYFDDDSQPGTPSTPKTPEMISHSPPMMKEKRKKKEGKKLKKVLKHQSPQRLDNDTIDIDMERPKTPEAIPKMDKMDLPLPLMNQMGPMPPIPFPFLTNFGGPGLIPKNPLFTPLPFPAMNLHNFGLKPYMSPVNSGVGLPTTQPSSNAPQTKPDESDRKSPISEKPSSISESDVSPSTKSDKKNKEHKKDKKDKLKKRNKKDKIKSKAEKKKLKEEKKEKIKKGKKEKRKDKEFKDSGGESQSVKITLKIKSPSPRPETPETRKLNIKPIVKKDDDIEIENDERKRETSPGLAKISALVTGPPKPKTVNPPLAHQTAEETIQEENHPVAPLPRTGPGPGRPRIHPIKPKPTSSKTPKKRRSPVKKDADGNEIWICPACSRQDDGSAMIGCDGCDAWYHWVCVGIQVPPEEREDWYCRHCLLKKNEDLQSDKQKKKRKKREKKDH